MAAVNDLAALSLFRALSQAELSELAGWFDVQTVSEGVRLAGEGATGYSFYVLMEGSAVVTANDVIVATYSPGDFFGEMALLGDGRRSASVTTTAPTKLLVMFGTEFRQLQASQPAIAALLEQAMQQRQQELLDLSSAENESSSPSR